MTILEIETTQRELEKKIQDAKNNIIRTESQLAQNEMDLNKIQTEMVSLGVTPDNINTKIHELEKSIEEETLSIKKAIEEIESGV